jgi:serine/threonine protein kinase
MVYRTAQTQASYAVKLIDLSKSVKAEKMADKEEAFLKALKHPNVVQYVDTFAIANYKCIVMELMTGGELCKKLNAGVGMPIRQVQRLFSQILDGVDYLHSRGVCHRDLKVDNILLDNVNIEIANAKISDLGMATVFK